MEVTGQILKDAYEKNPSKLSHILAEVIREFGYPNATDSEIQGICQKVINHINNKVDYSYSDPVAILINDWFSNGM